MCGQYFRNIDRLLIGDDMLLWLSRRDLKAETVCEIILTKDRALQTKHHATKILQKETHHKCRLCQQFD
jgi:hypothetical protein